MYNGRGILYSANGTIVQQGIFADNELVTEEKIADLQLTNVQPQDETPAPTNPPVVTDERKVALVIGNGSYEHAVPLDNPKNDATAMTSMLEQMGFEVVSGTDLGLGEMTAKIREFVKRARQADLALFFYAGHGIQVAGQNHLIPVDAKVEDVTALDFELVNSASITNHMGGLDKVGIVLLDACRDNPFTRTLARSLGTRSSQVGSGLAAISTLGGGLLVGFATAPGDVAADGDGTNSPFTKALLKHFPTPGMEIQRIMTRVKADVIQVTKNDQRPWHNSDLARDVFLTQAQQ